MPKASGEAKQDAKEAREAKQLREAEALLAELEEERQRQRKRRKTDHPAKLQAASALMAAEPGVTSPLRLPLQLLTMQRCVAWRWPNAEGKMQHMIGIGCSQPFSPFSDD
ncbi:unnamed protein product [Effrenium voratum]|nr:unnamed protein product [Effrenium voratum]CAJ1412404.1 unnamed protein product [Effrenium voratum]